MPPLQTFRRRKWNWLALVVGTMGAQLGCIRFRNDAPPSADAGVADVEGDAETPPEGGDAVVIPAPICSKFHPSIANKIAADLISQLGADCLLRRHFVNLPPIVVIHFEECLTAQIGQVMGCRHPDGEPFRYPTVDSKGRICRDMKSSHAGIASSDGDFDAFIADLNVVLDANGLDMADRMRVSTVFGATRNDIVRFKDAGPTLPCDAPDAD